MITVHFATPRKLPKARSLTGRVVVLDLAFASEAGGGSFETVTAPFIRELGPRLAAWVDHHDSAHHELFRRDARFILHRKADHGACPELITEEVVARAGSIDCIVCHNDFDGLASAAKWLRGGVEPYPGCDADARAIDTCLGEPSATARRLDRALRARPKDDALRTVVVQLLAGGLEDPEAWRVVDEAGAELDVVEQRTLELAKRFEPLSERVVFADCTDKPGPYDKTQLLLVGQTMRTIAIVLDGDSVTAAAPFDSGVDFLTLLGLSGGMPTRVSIPKKRMAELLRVLGVPAGPADAPTPGAR
jgi:hypothetical protein